MIGTVLKNSSTIYVYDEKGLIGTGVHERFIVDAEKFQAKANGKKM